MKTNGIIRKVDGLGRVVIPREFRKLHRIALGDPMEISCLDTGEIVLKKLDMTLALEEISGFALRTLAEHINGDVLISNLHMWISGNGKYKNRFINKTLPEPLKNKIQRREQWTHTDLSDYIPEENGLVINSYPIAGDCDVFGALYIVANPTECKNCEVLFQTTAAILGNSLQKF